MIDLGEEIELQGQLTNFEAYVFATTNKYIARHRSFKDISLAVADGGEIMFMAGYLAADDVSVRKEALLTYNDLLSARDALRRTLRFPGKNIRG